MIRIGPVLAKINWSVLGKGLLGMLLLAEASFISILAGLLFLLSPIIGLFHLADRGIWNWKIRNQRTRRHVRRVWDGDEEEWDEAQDGSYDDFETPRGVYKRRRGRKSGHDPEIFRVMPRSGE